MAFSSFLWTKYMGICEAMTSSTHSFAYSYRLQCSYHTNFNHRLSTSAIETRTQQLDLLPTLLGKPAEFCERMATCIYPTIEGSDHARLIYYFTLLQKSGVEVKGQFLTPDMHVKLLRKVKAAASSKWRSCAHSKLSSLSPIIAIITVQLCLRVES